MATVFDPWQLARVSADVTFAGALQAPALARLQRQRLDSLLRHVRECSPFYRARMQGLPEGADALPLLAPVRRQELMAQFGEWVTDPALRLDELRDFLADPGNIGEPWLGRYLLWESSGTSGAPGVFIQDARCMAIYDALEALRRAPVDPLRRWLDPFYLGERIAFVGATGGAFASLINVERLARIQPWLAGSVRSFSILQPLPALVGQLNAFAPTVLATYPTAATMLADEAEAGHLRLSLREVWTGGETLGRGARRRIVTQLACPVRNSYGSSEFLTAGWECRHGQLHLNSDWLLLEPVDEKRRPVPPGQPSAALLLTHLANTVQPLIRYEMSDHLCLLTEPCDCGSALPAFTIQGRDDDVFTLPAGDGRSVPLLPLALTTVLEDEAGLFDFQLCQREDGSLLLRLPQTGSEADAALARAGDVLRDYVQGQGALPPRIDGETGCATPRGRSGKACRILPHAAS